MPSSVVFAQYLPGALFVAGILLLIVLLIVNLARRGARRSSMQEDPREFIERVRSQARHPTRAHISSSFSSAAPGLNGSATPADGSALLEFDAMVRNLMAQLDNKTTMLELLLQQADERLSLLEDALDRAPGASISPAKAATGERAATTPTGMFPLPHQESVESLLLTVDDTHEPLPRTPGASLSLQTHLPSTVPVRLVDDRSNTFPSRPNDPLSASVCELSDRGRTPVEIAQLLDEQVGKVELILALRSA